MHKNFDKIDINHDFSEDYKNNIDPDKHNMILRKWHKILWSKLLPEKSIKLELVEKDHGLYYFSEIGEHYLTSDSIIHTYSRQKSISDIIQKIPTDEINSFFRIASRIGGYILFPGNRIGNAQTINGARGFNSKISDRFDLTLECIRLYYNNIIKINENPLGEVLNRYGSFFELFSSFRGYCDFFLLQDLTENNYSKINFFLPFTEFKSNPRPSTVDEYFEYMKNSINFVNKRNHRIKDFSESI